jgi:heat-inducible transcriptional repressor
MDDISTCVRVFNDRLIDTPMNQVSEKMESIKDIIRNVVKEYEFCIQQIIGKLFDKKLANTKTNITGRELLPSQPEFRDIEKLGKMLSFLEDTNV